ncbi:hypothetical protein ABI59_22520 [Acidobacteria bacterium Mor1]|nr:hypothetical protein ABI59_22520 [Acidobacteria bacterium Mor1]
MRNVSMGLICLVLCNSLVAGQVAEPELAIERVGDAGFELAAVTGETSTPLGFTAAAEIVATDAGSISGKLRWLRWTEDGVSHYALSRDGGRSWSERRRLDRQLQLKGRDVQAGEPMPRPSIPMPAAGRLFIVQGVIPWQGPMLRMMDQLGCEPLSYVHHHAYLTRCERPESAAVIAKQAFVERVEPFACSMRLAPELLRWIGAAETVPPAEQRINIVTVEPDRKQEIGRFARALGVDVAGEDSGGSLIDLTVDRDQLRSLACHDDFQYAERWHEPDFYMDNVRIDAGADWAELPGNGGYCGTGVRGEVLDSGFDTNHQEYASRFVLHGSNGLDTRHGTSVYGILFSGGVVDSQSKGLLPCATGIGGASSQVTCSGCSRFDYTEESQQVHQASFQSNSWGRGPGPDYGTTSHDMEEIIWRLDMAIVQAMNNEGKTNPQNVARDAWPKNIISVGGIHHQDTADPSDDWWCAYDCQTLHAGDQQGCTDDFYCEWTGSACVDDYSCGNIGPAEDGRIKPDLSYWFERIYTTATNLLTGQDLYTSTFGGTSAATPQVAGVLGLVLEHWADTSGGGVNDWGHSPSGATVFEKQPHAATLKALLINTAVQYPFSGAGHDMSRMHQGWGRPSIQSAIERSARSFVVDEEVALLTGQRQAWGVDVAAGQEELKVTLVYLDPPKTLATGGKELINDLDLRLVSPPDGQGEVTVYCGNAGLEASTESTALWTGPSGLAPHCDDPLIAAGRDTVNNVENVFVHEASQGSGVAEGEWTVEVSAFEVNADGNPNDLCLGIDIDPDDPDAGRLDCEAAGCTWDGTYGVCSDATVDVVFALVVTGAALPAPGESDGLMIDKQAGTLVLSWDPDCGGGIGYGIYRGDLAAGYASIAAEPGMCAVAGTTANLPLGSGAADFFLVVPNAAAAEGGYGADSAGIGRAPAVAACRSQQSLDDCVP